MNWSGSRALTARATVGDWVEVAATVDAVHLRDSKRAEGPTFAVGAEEWVAFLRIAACG
ncbi:DUF397 domain-containing protein [Streptomyces sp. NPDC051907]|uniref:DUF397 domain-containing protein n=1 Tax=Streptomyces sp. NPDC051907 TaxID=3155284 RepID=UPI0034466C82